VDLYRHTGLLTYLLIDSYRSMPRRRILLANNEIYHIYNKSVANEEIFTGARYQSNALSLLDYYRKPQRLRYSKFKQLTSENKIAYLEVLKVIEPYVEVMAFALMPNHYHLLVRQISDNGIQKFVANFQNSFAKFYNLKNERRGSLFINAFKSKRVENDNLLLHISRYIHLNPATSYILKLEDLGKSYLTSFPEYLNKDRRGIVNKDLILNIAGSVEKYGKFVLDRADYQRELKRIRSLTLE
jgi:putative transposase